MRWAKKNQGTVMEGSFFSTFSCIRRHMVLYSSPVFCPNTGMHWEVSNFIKDPEVEHVRMAQYLT